MILLDQKMRYTSYNFQFYFIFSTFSYKNKQFDRVITVINGLNIISRHIIRQITALFTVKLTGY